MLQYQKSEKLSGYYMTYQEFKNKYSLKLNKQQDEAVQSVKGSTLLLAVPGSGKTTVLVSRLGYMIYGLGIDPESILTMTYTIAATKDMKSRFVSFFGDEYAERLEFRTINGVCAKIIMRYESLMGRKAFELVTDERQTATLISQIYRDVEKDFPTESDIKTIRTLITYVKNMMLSRDEIKTYDEGIAFSEIYEKYNFHLRSSKRMDYDDQMLYAYKILNQYPDILAEVREKYKYICVDEAQDTSKIQHAIIKLIAGDIPNLFMVGDEDQSIYGFRAAYPDALLNFESDYKNSKILLMEENFRSKGNIVSMAQRFIEGNKYRHKKNMYTERDMGKNVRKIELSAREAQYSYLLQVASNPEKYTAVLYRDNESALPLIDLFERNGIKYNAKAFDSSFFSNRVVRDIADIINFSANFYDTELFLRIYYKLSTYLTKEMAQAACRISEERGISILDAIFELDGLSKGTEKACRSIYTHFHSLASEKAGNIIYRIANFMGYNDYLERMGIKTGKISILENIASRIYSGNEFLERLGELAEIVSNHKYDRECRFVLSTVHSSKGLEYDCVYLIDVIDSFFPETVVTNYNNADEDEIKAYEEERRLFYVAVTRAREELAVFSYAREISCFTDRFFAQENKSECFAVLNTALKEREYLEYRSRFRTKSLISHKHFGMGEIVEISGDIITVNFYMGITKKLSLRVLFEQGLCDLD